MARKPKSPRPSRGARAVEQANFKTSLAAAVAELQCEHNVNPGTIPMRVWRRLYIQGRTPQGAADQAAVSAYKYAVACRLAAQAMTGPWLKSHTGTKNKVTRG